MSVLDRFYQGDIRALSRIVSFVENRESGYRELLGRLYSGVGRSARLGITGPPGSGKSTLVNRLADHYLKAGKRVGIIAVDPTSPYTGGALLGDRVRMVDFPMDGSVYFRSMATRGAAGGLAASTGNVTVIYDAFGFDITIIETVGVGQVELDIVDACDTVAVVLVPESGDSVQTMKAGLMEIADIFAVNKADRPGAERIAAELKTTLDTRKKTEGAWSIPIVLTEAVNNKNTDRLYQAVGEHIAFQQKNGQFESHRRQQIRKKILSLLQNRFQQEFLEKLHIQAQFDQVADEIFAGRTNPYEISDKLYHKFRNDATP
jgi:LAO/AO transport system kinase